MKDFKHCQGMTLIELLVALVISTILVIAVYQALIGHERAYQVENQNIRMQYDARTALQFVTHELMMAGHGVAAPAPIGDMTQNINVFGTLINNYTDADSKFGDDDIDEGTDAIVFFANVGYGSVVADPTKSGDQQVNVYAGPSDAIDFAAGAMVNFIQLGHEKYTVNREINSDMLELVSVAVSSVTFPTNRTPGPGNPALTTLTFDAGLPYALDPGYYVTLQPVWIRYQVRNRVLERSISTDGFLDSKTTTTQALISNVEDFQLAYAFDNDDDGRADTGVDKTGNPTGRIIWAVDVQGDGDLDTEIPNGTLPQEIKYMGADLSNPEALEGDPKFIPLVAVKMSIVVRSERQNPDHRFRDKYRPLTVQDHVPASTAPDGFRRRLMERDVLFRNLL